MDNQQAATTWTLTNHDCANCGPRLHYWFTAGPRQGELQCRECFRIITP